jgi:hypothetical protein
VSSVGEEGWTVLLSTRVYPMLFEPPAPKNSSPNASGGIYSLLNFDYSSQPCPQSNSRSRALLAAGSAPMRGIFRPHTARQFLGLDPDET